MEDLNEVETDVRPVAQESLDTFEKIARSALAEIQKKRASGSHSSPARNTFTDGAAVRSANDTFRKTLEGNRSLTNEPAIARVVVADETGQKTTYYFSRTYAASLPGEKAKFTSYRSQFGPLAELEVGEEHTVRLGDNEVALEVVESVKFAPFLTEGKWDAENVVFQLMAERVLSADSLRKLLSEGIELDDNILDALLREESESAGIREASAGPLLPKWACVIILSLTAIKVRYSVCRSTLECFFLGHLGPVRRPLWFADLARNSILSFLRMVNRTWSLMIIAKAGSCSRLQYC